MPTRGTYVPSTAVTWKSETVKSPAIPTNERFFANVICAVTGAPALIRTLPFLSFTSETTAKLTTEPLTIYLV